MAVSNSRGGALVPDVSLEEGTHLDATPLTLVGALPATAQEKVVNSEEINLAARVRAGDVAAYEQLYRLYYQRLCEFATFYTKSLDDANDIVSDVFVLIWERREDWVPTNVTTYLFGAIRNRALNVVRDTRVDQRRRIVQQGSGEVLGLGDVFEAPDSEVEAKSERAWRMTSLRMAIKTLSEQQRTVMVLRWRFQKDWREIAQILQLSVTAAQMTHTRALQTLRARVGHER